jgi:23S rRNA (uridine2552-2'-O)-methyltransferase
MAAFAEFIRIHPPDMARPGAAKKHRFGKAWMHEHLTDHFVHEAQRLGYRSRAAFKLLEIAERDGLLRPGMLVVDLGAAPGSWSQVLAERLGPRGEIFALDLLPMDPVPRVRFVQGDFSEEATLERLRAAIGDRRLDLVLSDMAPNISGVASVDQARSLHLAELALDFAQHWLKPGGDLVVKLFQGAGTQEFQRHLASRFERVQVRKPRASRDRSREMFLVGRGFRG